MSANPYMSAQVHLREAAKLVLAALDAAGQGGSFHAPALRKAVKRCERAAGPAPFPRMLRTHEQLSGKQDAGPTMPSTARIEQMALDAHAADPRAHTLVSLREMTHDELSAQDERLVAEQDAHAALAQDAECDADPWEHA